MILPPRLTRLAGPAIRAALAYSVGELIEAGAREMAGDMLATIAGAGLAGGMAVRREGAMVEVWRHTTPKRQPDEGFATEGHLGYYGKRESKQKDIYHVHSKGNHHKG